MDNEIQELLGNLIKHALEDDQEEFRFLRSIREYFYYLRRRYSLKTIIKVLSKSSKRLLEDYCDDILAHTQNVTKLVAYTTVSNTVTFYKKDLATVDKMLGEYEAYLMSGNLLDFVFLSTRSEDKLVDHRRL